MEALGAPLDKIGPYWRKKMKAAIVGSSGYIASFLLERFSKETSIEGVLKIDQTEEADVHLDLANTESFDDSALEGIDLVAFIAAISGPDKCATDFDFCWKINVEDTRYFIQKAPARGCRVLFFPDSREASW